jgi:peptide-methionine (S)-S-oxide reductase
MSNPSFIETAVLGGGCFWCTEAVFSCFAGVSSVVPGYAGGQTANPTYGDVTSGETGHAEVIKIEFDPSIISYQALLDVFWHTHDPTTLNKQGADVGTQYRSIILTTSDEQQKQAEESKQEVARNYTNPIVTEIAPLDIFYEAEEYHHKYFENNQFQPYCQLVISPKVQKVEKTYGEKMKKV